MLLKERKVRNLTERWMQTKIDLTRPGSCVPIYDYDPAGGRASLHSSLHFWWGDLMYYLCSMVPDFFIESFLATFSHR